MLLALKLERRIYYLSNLIVRSTVRLMCCYRYFNFEVSYDSVLKMLVFHVLIIHFEIKLSTKIYKMPYA